MSLALQKAAPLTAEVRLGLAISQFEAELSAEQKAALHKDKTALCKSPPTIRDVMQLTAEIDRRAAEKSRGRRCFGPRFTNVLQAIQQFAALGDVVVGGSQNILACGVWSLVRMTLLSIVNLSSYLDKISALLMMAGKSAPRYEEMALLYPRSRNLQSQLFEYFLVVVRLCQQIIKMSKTSVIGQLLSFPSEADLKSYQSNLDQWAKMIKDEVSLLTGQAIKEQSVTLKSLLRLSQHQSDRRRQRARVRVLEACSTYDYQTTWRQIRKAGNSSLLASMKEYQSWKTWGIRSRTLVCAGKLGSGKSVLLANVVDDLNLGPMGGKSPVAYFFCRHDIPESLKAEIILGSLLRQLLQTISDLTPAEKFVEEVGFVRDPEKVEKLLQLQIPHDFKPYFVLDGLDECDGPQAQEVLKILGYLQERFPLRVCISSRLDSANVLLNPGGLAGQSVVTIPEDNPDIGDFINTTLAVFLQSGKLKIGNPTLILEIEDALLRGAQGMFLWVALQLESLCASKTDEQIRLTLSDLPKDLPQTFSRILRESGELGFDYQQKILELVLVAQRPLTTDELREVLSVVPGDTNWDPSRLLNDVHSALACCGCLITVDEEDLTVRLVHHSFKQFLLGEFTDQGTAACRITTEEANGCMGDIIVTYLNYPVFETQLSSTVVPQLQGLADTAPHTVIRSMGTPSHIQRLALKLLESRRKPGFNMGGFLRMPAFILLPHPSTNFTSSRTQNNSGHGTFFSIHHYTQDCEWL
ncbi:hypothetical protein QBC47DRAFT_54387 [Echria macrotheca]|uniref:NACHT domain-containing protein n=1 Tax=Echria macrotheca TaxID=438768 RepID=A0AAJ0F3A4_9PEZI|nr:hypothetical protein QBC47DRAFT_54387 [Echria macrotheca]